MLTLLTYVHDIDPFLIEFGDAVPILPGGVRWYGLSYLAGFLVAWWLVRRIARNIEHASAPLGSAERFTPHMAFDFVITCAIGVLVGGRFGYVLFYKIDLLWTFNASPPWWGALAINDGGMASHGGIIGVAAATYIFHRRHKISWPFLMDLTAFTAPLGLCFGRIANFINGELYGREAPADFSMAVKFPQEIFTDAWTTQQRRELIEMLPGEMRSNVGGQPLEKMIDALQHGNEKIALLLDSPAVPLTARYPSQLYQAAMEGLAVFIIGLIVWSVPRKPGIVGPIFLISYAVMRIIGEQFRQPDEHLGLQALGLTRGQWLSVIMLGVGGFCLWFFGRKDTSKVPGWRGPIRTQGG